MSQEIKPIRVLLVEDNPGDARLLQIALQEVRTVALEMTHVTRLVDGIEQLRAEEYAAVLLDLSLPDAHGLDTVVRVRDSAPELPIVVLTGNTDEELALTAVQNGAQDYLIKGEVSGALLTRSVRHAIERQRLQRQLETMSLMDELTGLYNRRGFFNLAHQQLRMADRNQKAMHLFFIDLDLMKQINDQLGHKEGDEALRETADVLRDTFRRSDILARMGGDEFVALAIESTPEGSEVITRRLQRHLDERNAQPGRKYPLSLSVGTTRYDPAAPTSVDELLSHADSAMYQQKQERRRARAHASLAK